MTRSINVLLWLGSVVTLLFIQSCDSPTSIQTYNSEMFPLQRGLQYEYSYIRTTISDSNKWIDSGNVVYLIKDSVDVSSTLRVWTISEDVSLMHQYFLTDQYGGMRLDSSYLINYNTIDILQENLSESHTLSCNSLIWKFPLDIKPASPEPFARYSSSSDPLLSYSHEYQSGPGNTVEQISVYSKQCYAFEKDKGLNSISYIYRLSSNVKGSSLDIRVTLL